MNGCFGGSNVSQVTQIFYNKMELQHSYSQRCVQNRYKLEECFEVPEDKCTNKLAVNEASGHRRVL